MKRLISGLLLAAAILAAPLTARAAAPTAFKAKGQVNSLMDGEPQEMSVVISFKGGKVRVETTSKDIGKSIMVGRKGHDEIAMLDPEQKMIVRMKPSALRGASNDDAPQFDTLLDPAGFKALVVKEGKKMGPGEGILGHKTTIYERTKGTTRMKVWLADDLELPLRLEGKSKNGDQFKMRITSLDLSPKFAKDDFDDSPAGYSEVKAETNEQN
ncbi:MAG: hypothetical protein FJZ01_04040 [Candidatus Sericytochromatia bacterium]|nr:hypothetical protein [Candidatus Tanganyikabacteria bacterium]